MQRPAPVFAFFFLVTLLLYGTTWRAGWAYDSIGWLRIVQRASFREHLNLAHHNGLSHYQFTQTVIWLMYRAFGTARLPYFLIHAAIHAFNAMLLWRICVTLLGTLNAKRPAATALLIAGLFAVSPYAGEVIVYKAAFHYGLAMAMLLGVSLCSIRFLQRLSGRYAIAAVALFSISLFSLELSYLTPVYCLMLTLWFRFVAAIDNTRFRAAVTRICAPQFLILGVFQLVNFLTSSEAGFSQLKRPLTFFAIKPPLFLLHLIWGRFFPQEVRDAWLKFFCTYAGAAVFYGGMLVLAFLLLRRLRTGPAFTRLAALGFAWMLPAMALSATMWFPERGFIYCDRYLFPMLPAASILIGCGILAIPFPRFRRIVAFLAIAASLAGTLFNNNLWWQSERVTDRLVMQLAEMGGTGPVLLLNSPWSFRGAPMIFPGKETGVVAMSDALYGEKHPFPVIDVMSFEMHYPTDGAGATIVDDSTIIVKLDGAGEWVREYGPARTYETGLFRAEIIDFSTYRLRLRARGLRLCYFRRGRLLQLPPPGVR